MHEIVQVIMWPVFLGMQKVCLEINLQSCCFLVWLFCVTDIHSFPLGLPVPGDRDQTCAGLTYAGPTRTCHGR